MPNLGLHAFVLLPTVCARPKSLFMAQKPHCIVVELTPFQLDASFSLPCGYSNLTRTPTPPWTLCCSGEQPRKLLDHSGLLALLQLFIATICTYLKCPGSLCLFFSTSCRKQNSVATCYILSPLEDFASRAKLLGLLLAVVICEDASKVLQPTPKY